MKDLFRRDWEPAGEPRAAVALVHGLGEHSGRYERLAERFNSAGFALSAIDLRGHGQSPGARGDTRLAPALEDVERLVASCAQRGVPVFVYGHSLGALLTVLWLLRRPDAAERVAGAVISAIGLHSALREQAAKVRAARVLGRWVPRARVMAGIDPATISRDGAVVAAYKADKLVHDTASLGFGLDALNAVDAVRAAPAPSVPLLVVHGSDDALAYVSGARELAERWPEASTLRVYAGLYHELHNEPEQQQVFADVLAWMEDRL